MFAISDRFGRATRRLLWGAICLSLIAFPAVQSSADELAPSGAPAVAATDPVLVAAGDIASCSRYGDSATAALIDRIDGTVAALGDLAYDSGTADEFAQCYDPTWGRFKQRTRPTPGNHEYGTPGAADYFAYFGPAAGDPATGYYSYDLGAWHIVVLNSNCNQIGGCGAGSAQEQWLRADLAAHPAPCTLAYWHHPRFSSGRVHGSHKELEALWQALYDFGAEAVLSGHEHNYERFSLQGPMGRADAERGIRQFVVGTGGRGNYEFRRPRPNSEIRNDDAFGVLKLTLRPTSYDWEFVPVLGEHFRDAGSEACH